MKYSWKIYIYTYYVCLTAEFVCSLVTFHSINTIMSPKQDVSWPSKNVSGMDFFFWLSSNLPKFSSYSENLFCILYKKHMFAVKPHLRFLLEAVNFYNELRYILM